MFHMVQQTFHFGNGEYHRQSSRALRMFEIPQLQRPFEYLLLVESKGIQRLILCAGRNIVLRNEPFQELTEAFARNIIRGVGSMQATEPVQPLHVTLFRAYGVVP